MSGDTMRFDIDGTPVQLALAKVASGMKIVEREFVKLSKTSTQSTEETRAAQERLFQAYTKLNAEKMRLIQTEKQHIKVQDNVAMSVGRTNQMIGAMAFAVDDFVTIFQLANDPVDGFIRGMRAAANNISVLLLAINPLYAIIPSLATAIGGPLVKAMFGASDASKQLSADLAENSDKIREMIDEASKLKLAKEEVENDAKVKEMDRIIKDAEVGAAAKAAALREAEKKAKIAGAGAGNMADAGIFGAFGFGPDVMPAADDAQKKADEALVKAIGEENAARREVIQARQARDAIVADMEAKRGQAEISKKLGPMNDQLQGVLVALMNQGIAPDKAVEEVMKGLELGNDPNAKNVITNIARDAAAKASGNALDEGVKGILTPPAQKDLDKARDELEAFQRNEQDSAIDRQRRGVKRPRDEEAAARETELSMKRAVDALEELVKSQKKTDIDNADDAKKVLQLMLEELKKMNRRVPIGGGNQ